MAKKSKAKKKKSFILSDEELDKVSGGSGPAVPVAKKITQIAIQKGLPGGGISATPTGPCDGRPAPGRRSVFPGSGGGEQM